MAGEKVLNYNFWLFIYL